MLETSGQVSVLLRSDCPAGDARAAVSSSAADASDPAGRWPINDGRLLRDNMKKMDVDDAWLQAGS
ncbi:MAG: hypothetical protein ACLU38_05370 [Dysosmobacter sp.]